MTWSAYPHPQALAYIRVSTAKQVDEGVSLDAQKARIEEYCQYQGIHLVDVIVEAGVSGGKQLHKRAKGKELLRRLKNGEADTVISIKLDRLFRNCADCLQVTERWVKAGIVLHLLDLEGRQSTRAALLVACF